MNDTKIAIVQHAPFACKLSSSEGLGSLQSFPDRGTRNLTLEAPSGTSQLSDLAADVGAVALIPSALEWHLTRS